MIALKRLGIFLVAGLLVLLALLLFVFTTEQGTRFVLQKVAQETNLKITYDKGTLYQGCI